jgi:glycerophosphoryl diester phosphodiesterase
VIAHDRALNPDFTRDAAGQWIAAARSIGSMSFDELQRYDVGRLKPETAYAKRFAKQQAIDGTRIPKLEALFALVKARGNATVRFNIETKLSPLAPEDTVAPEAFVAALLDVIRAAGMEARVTIQSFDWRTLAVVQKAAPRIPTVYLTAAGASPRNIAPASPWMAGHDIAVHGGSLPRTVKAAGGAIWSPWLGDLTEAAVREAQAVGLKVVVWTVNAESDMRRLVAWGVDGIISDYPDVLMNVARSTKH